MNPFIPPKGEHYSMTASGRFITLLDPKPEQIVIEDIAEGLAKSCRFAGQMPGVFYTVAQHSVLVSERVLPKDSLYGLLHDAAEAYINDIPSPVKRLIPRYSAIEDILMAAITDKFGLPAEMPASVKRADEIMLVTEAHNFCHDNHVHWTEGRPKPREMTIIPWSWQEARERFLDRFNHLVQDMAA